jgi:hypothetical protein
LFLVDKVTDQLSNPFYRGFIGQCGLNKRDIDQFETGADHLHAFSHHLNDGFRSFETDILSCSTMNPNYSSLMHDGRIIEFVVFFHYSIFLILHRALPIAFCVDAVQDGLIWIYSTTLSIAVFSMVSVIELWDC